MKKATIFILGFLTVFYCSAQQNDWASVEKVFGKKGTVQGDVFKVSYPRTDLTVNVNGFAVAPGLALGSWVGLMSMNKNMGADKTMGNNQATMMGDLVLLDTEVPAVLKQLVEAGLKITAIHNHLINETPM